MAKSGKIGRPRKYSDEEITVLIEKFEKYVDETDIPIVSEFAYKNNIMRDQLYEYAEFATVLKKCIEKKESQLEKLGLLNVVNPTMAIFSLKQLGWRDKQITELTGKDGGAIEIDSPREEIERRISGIASRLREKEDTEGTDGRTD